MALPICDANELASTGRQSRVRMFIASVALAMVSALLIMTVSGCAAGNSASSGSEASSSAAASQESGSQSSEASSAASEGSSDSAASASSSSASDSASASASGRSSVSASSKAAAKVDPRSFDAQSNVTLRAICELTGKKLQGELENGGYKWTEAPRTWLSSTGALVEVQGDGGLLTRDEIDRLDTGAEGSSVAFVVAVNGYETPEAALDGLSANTTVQKKHVNTEGDVAFASIRNSEKDDYLVAVTKTDNTQQTLLVFTEKAVKDGLFAEVTGISSVKSIEGLWKALGVR